MTYVNWLSKDTKSVKGPLRTIFNSISIFTLVLMVSMTAMSGMKSMQTLILPIIILAIRLNCGAVQSYRYHLGQLLFPVMMRGKAFGICNFVCRPFASVATIVVEYTTQPFVFILPMSLLCMLVVNNIQEME